MSRSSSTRRSRWCAARRYPHPEGARRRHAVRHRRLLHQRGAQPLPGGTERSVGGVGEQRSQRLAEIDETTAAMLRFGGERVASFVTSFNASDVGSYRIVGTRATCTSIRRTSMPRDWPTSDRRLARPRDTRATRSVCAPSCCTSPTASGDASRSPPARKACRTCGSSKRSTSRRDRPGRHYPAVQEARQGHPPSTHHSTGRAEADACPRPWEQCGSGEVEPRRQVQMRQGAGPYPDIRVGASISSVSLLRTAD